MGLEFFRAYVVYMEMTKGVMLRDNMDCVKEIINKDYWEAKKEVDKADNVKDNKVKFIILAIVILAMFAIALVLFICYIIKQRKSKEEDDTIIDTTDKMELNESIKE